MTNKTTWKEFNKAFKKLELDKKLNYRVVRDSKEKGNVLMVSRYLRSTKTLTVNLMSYGVLDGIECSSRHSTDGTQAKVFKLNPHDDDVIGEFLKMIKKMVKYKPSTGIHFWE